MAHSAQDTAEALRRSGTAVISDVFDNLGLTPPTLANDLWPTRGPGTSFAGPAYTVEGTSRLGPNRGDREKLQAIDDMPAGSVALWAGGDILGVCCFGDLLASAMKCRGVTGVIVDGGVRDLAYLRSLELPMLVRYRTPSQAIGRWKVTAAQVPVRVRGALADWVTVYPGDLLVADDDGAIAVPASLAGRVAELAAAWEAKDQGARRDILGGVKLLEALARHGAL
ncbi:MAG: RraA family protein [Deferrisomatales bacterium]|nr:RraA family protein [Deferrisomatales bacterium]